MQHLPEIRREPWPRLVEKAAGRRRYSRILAAAPGHGAAKTGIDGMDENHLLNGPGHGHIKKPAFILKFDDLAALPTIKGKGALLKTGENNEGPFQAFGPMHRGNKQAAGDRALPRRTEAFDFVKQLDHRKPLTGGKIDKCLAGFHPIFRGRRAGGKGIVKIVEF